MRRRPIGNGAVMNIATPTGSNSFKGSASDVYAEPRLARREQPERRSNSSSNSLFDGSVGGPVLRDRSWFFSSFRKIDRQIGIGVPADQIALAKARDRPRRGSPSTMRSSGPSGSSRARRRSRRTIASRRSTSTIARPRRRTTSGAATTPACRCSAATGSTRGSRRCGAGHDDPLLGVVQRQGAQPEGLGLRGLHHSRTRRTGKCTPARSSRRDSSRAPATCSTRASSRPTRSRPRRS